MPHASGLQSPLFVTENDEILISARSSIAITIIVTGRIVTEKGLETEIRSRSFAPATDRSESTFRLALSRGYLYSLAITTATASIRRGHCYVKASLLRVMGNDTLQVGQLIGDYVTSAFEPTWPTDTIKESTEGPGLIRSVLGTDPAVNTEAIETVPTNALWRLISKRVTLVTSTQVGNRVVDHVIDDGATTLYRNTANTSQVASTTRDYIFSTQQVLRGSDVGGIPDFHTPAPLEGKLLEGFRIRTVTAVRQNLDNFGAPQLWVEEWILE